MIVDLTWMCAGKMYGFDHDITAGYMQFPVEVQVLDLSSAGNCTLALTEAGDVYFWGKNQVSLLGVCVCDHDGVTCHTSH